jgi:hypothetical protein
VEEAPGIAAASGGLVALLQKSFAVAFSPISLKYPKISQNISKYLKISQNISKYPKIWAGSLDLNAKKVRPLFDYFVSYCI